MIDAFYEEVRFRFLMTGFLSYDALL